MKSGSKDISLDYYLSVCFLSYCTHDCYVLLEKILSATFYFLYQVQSEGDKRIDNWLEEELQYYFMVVKLTHVLMVQGPMVLLLENFALFSKC